jgi:2-(1,2-epoxy-1,2-dihydrophenyl)acetyl-CoA isomerase
MPESSSEFEMILTEQRDAVLVITMNRPERLNAWLPQMSREMSRAILAANDDPSVGAVVLTGAGRGFCAGADISGEFGAQLDRRDAEPPPAERQPADVPAGDWVRLCREAKPLVAAINGPAIGVGLSMVLPFDRLVAARSAKLSARFVRMGVVPELASSHFLVARCGWGAASWFALSGATVTGEEARELRLVDRVVDDGDALDAALEDAALLAANPAPQLRMTKDLLTANAAGVDLAAVQRRELAALEVAYRTPEHREAVTAFIEKRPPDFRAAARG